MSGSVYGIHAGDGVVRYIGITVHNPAHRFNAHKAHAKSGRLDRPFYHWLREHVETAGFITLEVCDTDEELWAAERRWIASLPGLLNLTVGGNRGTRHSDESKLKMRDAHRNRTPSEAELAYRRAPRIGRPHTDEAKAKIREKRALQVRGPQTEKQKQAAREAQLRRWAKYHAEHAS